MLNHSLRAIKKRKSILVETNNLDFIEEDGALSTENGDLTILLEFDLDSNFKFIPYRTELNNLIANNRIHHSSQLSTLQLNFKQQQHSNQNKSIAFLSQTNEQLPELLLQRIAFCNEHSGQWRQQIKLAHDIIPKPPPIRSFRNGQHQTANLKDLKDCKIHRTNSLSLHNNNDAKRICICERCQFKRINGLKPANCIKMPSMDNILLRSNEFNTLISNQSSSMITQLFNK